MCPASRIGVFPRKASHVYSISDHTDKLVHRMLTHYIMHKFILYSWAHTLRGGPNLVWTIQERVCTTVVAAAKKDGRSQTRAKLIAKLQGQAGAFAYRVEARGLKLLKEHFGTFAGMQAAVLARRQAPGWSPPLVWTP